MSCVSSNFTNDSDEGLWGFANPWGHHALQLSRLCLRRADRVRCRMHIRPTSSPQRLDGGGGARDIHSGFSGETIMAMLGPNPTQERFGLAAYYPHRPRLPG
jgi:hypothetical protein